MTTPSLIDIGRSLRVGALERLRREFQESCAVGPLGVGVSGWCQVHGMVFGSRWCVVSYVCSLLVTVFGHPKIVLKGVW